VTLDLAARAAASVGPAPALDAVLVINVKAFVERRRHVEAQLARVGLTGRFVHDFDAGEIPVELDRRHFTGSELNAGQKSCALKHIEALRMIVRHGWQRCLVLEDDVVLAADFSAGLQAALGEAQSEPHPHVIYLGAGGNFYTPASQRRPGRRLYEAAKGRFADSYVIGADAAQQRLAALDAAPIAKPIDVAFEAIDRAAGIRFLWLEPPVVEQGSKLGLFRTTLEPAPPNWLQAIRYRLERWRRKFLYQLWR
jgi:glycosyl transferase family 25